MNPENFLKSLVDYEREPAYDYDLDKFLKYLEELGSPQDKLHNIIHIGGTKGKGSCTALLASCLTHCGYTVGHYTSPHLDRLNERIRINGRPIMDQELNYYIGLVKKGRKQNIQTFFEAMTAFALLHFVRRKTDLAILEVGLGGRIDATNAVTPLITVMTRIGYDHTGLLGSRLTDIAKEKCGIIKTGGTMITIKQRPSVQKVIDQTCRSRSCSLQFAEHLHSIRVIKATTLGSYLKVAGRLGNFSAYLPLPGYHQVENLLIVLAVIHELITLGYNLPLGSLREGIRRTRLHGRFETLPLRKSSISKYNKRLTVIFDVAHNPDSFRALLINIRKFKIRNFYLIFGTSRDKQISFCIKHIFPRAKGVVLVKADNERAVGQKEIFLRARRFQKHIKIARSIKEAFDHIAAVSDKNDTIIITGSFYLWQSVKKSGYLLLGNRQ